MQTTRTLLEAVKVRHQLRTDYQLAKFLGISRQNISNNMHGGTMSDETSLLVADALGLPGEHVMAVVAAERTKSEKVRKAWQRAAAATAALVLVAVALAVQFALSGEAGNYWTISAFAGAAAFDPLTIIRSGICALALAAAALTLSPWSRWITGSR